MRTKSLSPPEPSRNANRFAQLASRHSTDIAVLAAILVVAIIAIGTRVVALDRMPPGLGSDELRLVQHARDTLSLSLDPSTDVPYGPGYHWLIRWAGALSDWDITILRVPSVMLGLVTVAALTMLAWRQSHHSTRLVALLASGLVATSLFPFMVFGSRIDPAIAGCALAAIALLCIVQALTSHLDPATTTRRWWWAGAAIALGLGLYTHLAFIFIVPAALAAGLGFALWRQAGTAPLTTRAPDDRRALLAAIVVLLVMSIPFSGQVIADPSVLRGWLEVDWDGNGSIERVRGPWSFIEGYAVSWRRLLWAGHDAWLVNLPGRPLLDPLLIVWIIGGLIVLLRHPGRPTHALTIGWMLLSLVPSALVAPGHPGLMLPVVPALFICLTAGIDGALHFARSYGARWILRRAIPVAVGMSVLVSSLSSLYAYVWSWSNADDTFFAYHGDTYDALLASERLAARTDTPVYLSLPAPDEAVLMPGRASNGRALATLLADDSASESWIDGQTTLTIPTSGSGIVIYPASALPEPSLRALLGAANQAPVETGRTPEGDVAWEAWRVDQRTREALPYTVPTIRFPDGYELIGFSVAPDFGDVATTGQLPDPDPDDQPRVAVILVWSAPASSGPHIVRVRLVPSGPEVDPITAATMAQLAETVIAPSQTVVNGSVRELIVTRLSVAVPSEPKERAESSPRIVLDVQAGLLAADGRPLPPLEPPSVMADGFAHLNQIEYVRDGR